MIFKRDKQEIFSKSSRFKKILSNQKGKIVSKIVKDMKHKAKNSQLLTRKS